MLGLLEVINADLSQLKAMPGGSNSGSQLSIEAEVYKNAKIHYLEGDTEALAHVTERAMAELGSSSSITDLIDLRLGVRRSANKRILIERILRHPFESSLLIGEFYMVAGRYFENRSDYHEAKNYYYLAYLRLVESAPNQAYLGLFNHLAIESRLKPRKRYLSDLRQLLEIAIHHDCLKVAGLSSLAMASEFEKLGAAQAAIHLIDRALSFFSHESETLHFQAALARKALCLLQIGQKQQAMDLVQELSQSPHLYIRDAMKVAGELAGEKKNNLDEIQSLNWKDYLRVRRNRKKRNEIKKLTTSEQSLLAILASEKCNRLSLAKRLFGEKIDDEHALNRLGNLLSRFHKKWPGLIKNIDGHYQIFEPYYFSKKKQKSQFDLPFLASGVKQR